METKEIKSLEKNENVILGQESVFGWNLKSKKRIKNVALSKANEYTLVRNRDESKITQAHRDIEARWDELYDKRNNEFVFKTYPYYFCLTCVLATLFIIMGIVTVVVGLLNLSSEGLIACFVILILLFVCIVVISILLIPKFKKIFELDKICREMRQVNLIRNDNSVSYLNKFKIVVNDQNLSEENLNDLKTRILNTLLSDKLFKICDINKYETEYQVLFGKEDCKIHILLKLGSSFENNYLEISYPIGDEYWVNDNKVNVDISGDHRFIPINEYSEAIKIKWLISYSVNGRLKKFDIIIELPIMFEIN